jgi:hypothetical protein
MFNRIERGRLDNAGPLRDRSVLLRPPVRGEIEHLVLALAAEIEVEVGNDDFVRERLRFSDDPAVGIHDAGAPDQSGAILVPALATAIAQVAFM